MPVSDELRFWTPECPNLYALLLSLKVKKQNLDVKYERFGWREWTLNGTVQCLNGKPYQLRGDSWHFMGIPQMTRRYAWRFVLMHKFIPVFTWTLRMKWVFVC